ncbi:Cytochrome c556 [Marinobacter sp. es.042]|jgi:cytochrome c556|uniref:c-type cytochrome n=1 Tax=Marinobacter sp. es.042 TaxID=1761794 RepID=UPI000B50FC38|nr:cytochrome c [Marinobacter sp. es.042]SNB55880.1 Cytochrome c556 [Marinobacter sp. es.042]
MKKTGILATAIVGLAFAGTSVAQMDVEDQIEARQAAYQFMSWNMGKIKAQAVDEEVEFNPQQIMAAANAIAAAANSGLGALYSPDSAMDKAEDTRLKPEFFEQPEKAREVGGNFVREANKLQEVAASGDKAAIAQQFAAVGKSCKACHDNFRAD